MDTYMELFELIGALARRRFQAAERHFAALGLSHSEARLLRLLAQGGGSLGQDELTSGLHIDRTNGGRALKRLEDLGYVERSLDSEDRRRRLVRLTAAGRRVVGRLSKLRLELVRDYFGGLSEADARQALSLLAKVAAHD